MPSPHIPFLGEAASLGAAISWAVALAMYRVWGRGVPAVSLNLLKNSVAVAGLVLLIALTREPRPGGEAPWGLLALSGVIGIGVSDTLVLAGLNRVGTTLTAASFCLAAPIAAVLAGIFLGERLSAVQWVGILCAVGATAGVSLLQRTETPTRVGAAAGLWLLFAGQITNAIGIVIGHHALGAVGVLYGTLLRIAPAIVFLLPWQWRHSRRHRRGLGLPAGSVLALLVACVIGTLIGLVLMSAGLKYTRVGIAAALNATYPIWAIPIAVVFLGERVRPAVVALIAVAVAGIGILFLA